MNHPTPRQVALQMFSAICLVIIGFALYHCFSFQHDDVEQELRDSLHAKGYPDSAIHFIRPGDAQVVRREVISDSSISKDSVIWAGGTWPVGYYNQDSLPPLWDSSGNTAYGYDRPNITTAGPSGPWGKAARYEGDSIQTGISVGMSYLLHKTTGCASASMGGSGKFLSVRPNDPLLSVWSGYDSGWIVLDSVGIDSIIDLIIKNKLKGL